MSSRVKEDVQKLFEFWCEVTRGEKGQKVTGFITESFPESFRDEQIITKIPDFAYPCEFENDSVQTYSFVLTSDDSKWRFGFCRHDPKTQTAMVIITYLPWHDTYLRLLSVLSELRRTQNGEFESFLSEAYNKGVPEPGASLKLFYSNRQNHFMFQKPSQFQLPSIPENHNLNLYYNFVDPKNMIAVFAAMLAERRIIFTSRRLDKLSSCIQAANAFLYPMVWQHIFIPILPMKMKDILSAPMPYLMGVPEEVLKTMTPEELGDVVILNCDIKIFQSQFDDVRQMPPELVSQMKKQLTNTNEHMGDRVSKIFLRVLVQLIGGYRDAVRFSPGQKITWDRDQFVESRPPHLRPFLARMMELQIFQQFIDERIDMLNTGLGFSDEFEMETLRYSEKMGKRGKNYKEFLRNVKDKTNPAVKSAVKSVKEGSRGVKTAYKDLKSKLRDITPPKSQFHTHFSQAPSHETTGHRSAPNSPVFGKRAQSSDYNLSGSVGPGNRKPYATSMQTSNSQTMMNGFNNYTNHNSNINNNNINNNLHLSKSPTISPSSSLCSSDMNISQELQNHPLFKSPIVDRSLKPSNSLDYTGYRTARFGPPASAPLQRPPPPPSISLSSIDVPLGNLCLIDDTDNDADTIATKSDSPFTNDSLFDSPPDMPSPPIPPKRTNNSTGNLLKDSPQRNGGSKPVMGTSLSASFGFESNFVNNHHHHHHNNSHTMELDSPEKKVLPQRAAPIPAPRHKTKETPSPPRINVDATKDLISLDEGNTSFDLEDFDPLNQNAKPLPSAGPRALPSSSNQNTKSITLPSTSSSNNINPPTVHNPLYPYFSPQHRHGTATTIPSTTMANLGGGGGVAITPAAAAASTSKDDDFELLRKYGLDQFSLTNGSTLKTMNKSNWTTFD